MPGGVRAADRAHRVRADKAYAFSRNRACFRRRGNRCTIPDKADQARNRLKRHRAVATRCDKSAVRYQATVLIAALNEWL
ncbi:hypothetical protein [Streptomyces sp. NRRL F-5755]|uniref:hypothetical protein n=1 Tax=Streptomyces sp. NRRL F-5755 TaxID=1519475 RepID=UPI000AC54C59